MHRPFVISHAACKGHTPENTLLGVRRAIELGADGIEIDVHASRDGVPVLIHDDTVDRTTDGSGAVSQMTLARLQKLDAGDGERVPTLAETLDLTRGRVLLVMEVKQAGIERRVLRIVRDQKALNDCVVHSFNPQVVGRFRALEPALPAALLTAGLGVADWDQLFAFALSLNAQGLSVLFGKVDAELVRRAHRRKLTFYTWTVNEIDDMRRMRDCGVDAITTDYPDRLRTAL
ncbi:MAG: glycerophosphodiester phosphodiesterase family protein [Dehalococcoidia bacterium]